MNKITVIAIRHPSEPSLFLHGLRKDNHKWSLPGGHAKPGETPHESASRELEEETGIKGVKLDKIHNTKYGNLDVHLFSTDHIPDQLDTSKDPDAEFVTFKYLDPTEHENLHVPKHKNILVDWMKSHLRKDQPTLKLPKVPNIPSRLDTHLYPVPGGQKKSDKRQRDIVHRSQMERIRRGIGIKVTKDHPSFSKFKDTISEVGQAQNRVDKGIFPRVPGLVSTTLNPADKTPVHSTMTGMYSQDFENANKTRSTPEHEAAHMLMGHVEDKYGMAAKEKLIDHVLAHFHPEDRNAMFRSITGGGGYKPDSDIQEEMINQFRDYLSDPNRRNDLNRRASMMGTSLDHNRMKTSWKNATSYVKNITPEWLKGNVSDVDSIQQKASQLKPFVGYPQKLAASEVHMDNLKKALKIKVEPFTADPGWFNPKKHDFKVSAIHNGKEVGRLYVTHKPEGIMPFELNVDQKHRRKGYASAMASHAQKISGKKIVRSSDMTEDGRNFANKFIKP
jgi:8-oxo-dGTP pyrophosphatase MutT (NUDIX family)